MIYNKVWQLKCLVFVTFCVLEFPNILLALTVDNELVSARSDCFERIALEAMLPFEKAFNTEDTNSLKTCKERCIQAGEKCQSISFGVHRRGNGTCQLSREKYEAGNGRPGGILFDPDFDLYARRLNCFDLSDNSIALSDSFEPSSADTGYGGGLVPSPPVVQLPNRPADMNVPLLIVNPMPTTETTLHDQPLQPTGPYGGVTQEHVLEVQPASNMGTSTTDNDRLYFSQDIYPLYKYPMLYEPNYPAPNTDVYIPGGYATNIPEVEDGYRPPAVTNNNNNINGNRGMSNGPPRPMFGMGYGNAYSYGPALDQYTSTTQRALEQLPLNEPTARPSYAPRPGPYGNDYSDRPNNYYPRPEQDHEQRPEYGQGSTSTSQGPSPFSPGQRPSTDFVDYNNRPDPPQNGYTSRPPQRDPSTQTGYSSTSNRYDFVRRNGTSPQPPGYNGDKMIATIFNPNDYMSNYDKTRPGMGGNRDRPQAEHGQAMNQMRACFRRVLAGKRIAPHWVRRTIACERVEECMRECGHEKRFMCEGFNYRLDPTGHGQGDCELIDIPLAEMDLYSSTNKRDSNLLRHPDYDYYERDRNAPNSCNKNVCRDCSKPLASPPLYIKPSSWSSKPHSEEHYIPSPPSSSGFDSGPHHHRPHSSTAVDHYRPSGPPSGPPPAPHIYYDRRPSSHGPNDPHLPDYHSGSYEFSSHGSGYFEHTPPSSYGSSSVGGPDHIDRYDSPRQNEHRYRPSRPDRWEALPSSTGYDVSLNHRPHSPEPQNQHHYRPPYRPGPDYSPYRPYDKGYDKGDSSYRPQSPYDKGYDKGPPIPPRTHAIIPSPSFSHHNPPSTNYKGDWGSYGGSYGGNYNKQSSYWGLSHSNRRKDPADFNYFELGAGSSHRPPPPSYESNSVMSYPGGHFEGGRDRHDYRHQWTRRPGPDECSAKTSEGFRLHKTAIKHSMSVPSITECERLCSGQDGFNCQTYSYRYTPHGHENCMLCDRPVNLLDFYVDIEPDRNYDIYSMTDDVDACRKPPSRSDGPAHIPSTAISDPRNAQCFFRAVDATRFFKSIVRDSLTVRSVGECEMECIKSTKFTCRAFAFRYGQQRHAGVIDNCQLSDWPVRDMNKERHLVGDASFDIFERASYGHGCEIQPLMEERQKKLCYLGYGSAAKLLSAAIKKVITVPSELACKKECIRFRETSSFKCYSFSYGAHEKTHNCELSDLDQTELKLNVHYTHTSDRDYWLFAWNPFDYTCRDKVNSVGGGSRINNDRRMDIFREPGELTWRHYTVGGKPCRNNSPCEKNHLTGFYSCEIEAGNEKNAWDYCCKADHPCGYSQGYEYPWCFVGDEHDQWRKCSDRYYPTNHTHAGLTVPQKHKIDNKKKHKIPPSSEFHQHPPRPGGLQSISDFAAARLWPVTYLYSEGPPNSTEFSNFVDCNKDNC